jgi:GxxExxY protein
MAEFLASAINELSYSIIACGIEVHRHLGPGLLERTYQGCLEYELRAAGLSVACGVKIPIDYKGMLMGAYELDLIVQDLVIVEVKSVAQLAPVHDAQLIAYLKATAKPLGLLINFNVPVLRAGIRRRLNKDHSLAEPDTDSGPRDRDM